MDMENNINAQGEYIFYQDGIEISRSKNILTKYGKRYITEYLSGQSSNPLKDIAIGIGSTMATVNDTQLGFEYYKARVTLSSPDIQTSALTGLTTYGVVYKATLPPEVSGIINEIGLYPSVTLGSTDYSSRSISNFESGQYWLDDSGLSVSTVSSPTPLIGTYYIPITATSSSSKKYSYDLNLDLSGYSANDSMTIAYNQNDTNLDYIFVRAYSSVSDYYEIRFAGDLSIGTKIKSLTLNNLYSSTYGSGTPDNTSITRVSVGVKAKSSGSSTVLMDGLRINDEDSFRSDYGLISRSVLLSPITKSLGRQMDIEYRLGLTF
jgi:hypothetical protein